MFKMLSGGRHAPLRSDDLQYKDIIFIQLIQNWNTHIYTWPVHYTLCGYYIHFSLL